MSQIVQMFLPWHDPAGELQYSSMTLSDPAKVDARKARRILRNWYKEALGVTAPKHLLVALWSNRTVSRAQTEKAMMQELHNMARETYETYNKSTDTDSEEAPVREAAE